MVGLPPARVSRSALTVLLTVLTGCQPRTNEYVAPPPPTVTVATPRVRMVPDVLEATGVTRGTDVVEVRARVRGFLAERHVQDGQRVQKGDLLFTIDPREYEAALRQSQADVASREADLRLKEILLQRAENLLARQAASQLEFDQAAADRDVSKAQLALALAQLDAAKLNVEFTRVTAPIAGRVGIDLPRVGQLVGANDATLLTTIINEGRVYATYTIDEQQLLQLRRANANRRPDEDGRRSLDVYLGLADEAGYPHQGRFAQASNTVDPTTGTITVEAEFENTSLKLLPGLYVRLQAQLGECEAMLVPETAVLTDQQGKFVLVVNERDEVERRPVTIGQSFGPDRSVLMGLTPEDRVVVNGLQRARPGIKVTVTQQAASPAETAAATSVDP